MKADAFSDDQFKILSKKLLETVEKSIKILPLNTLKHHRYTLRRPLYITIEFDKTAVIASLDDIEAFACGDTEFEAINNLCDDIVSLYEDMKQDRSALGRLPLKWLDYLEDIIETR